MKVWVLTVVENSTKRTLTWGVYDSKEKVEKAKIEVFNMESIYGGMFYTDEKIREIKVE